MFIGEAATLLVLAGITAAKVCINQTVPVTISARTGVFNYPVPATNIEATAFIQNQVQQGRNFSNTILGGYKTTAGTYQISTQFCSPSKGHGPSAVVQILTHGIGFDKTYWDLNYNNFNYSYVNVATDTYGYSTLTYDRLGIGNSSHGEPLNEIQTSLEVAALAELTLKLRNGTFPQVTQKFSKITHVGHSFGSAQTYALVAQYPTISDGIVLTGFSLNTSFTGYFAAGADFQIASLNQPFRLGNASTDAIQALLQQSGYANPSKISAIEPILDTYSLTNVVAGLSGGGPSLNYPAGYLANANPGSNQFNFFLLPYFDPGILYAGEAAKQPVTIGELLTLASGPQKTDYAGPVLFLTASADLPFCGGDCFATGDPSIPSIPAAGKAAFPNVAEENFEAYIQPRMAHGINAHYNATGAYDVINKFLQSKLSGGAGKRSRIMKRA